jgi:hypothetical protein
MKKIILLMLFVLISLVSISNERSVTRYEKTYCVQIEKTIIKPIKSDNHIPYICKSLDCNDYSVNEVSNYYLCIDLYYLGGVITDNVQIELSNNKQYDINEIYINNVKGKYYSVIIPINNEIINDLRNYNINKINIGYNNEKIINNNEKAFLQNNIVELAGYT